MADGGRTDKRIQICNQHHVQSFTGAKGRGKQMNFGASQVKRNNGYSHRFLLLFLGKKEKGKCAFDGFHLFHQTIIHLTRIIHNYSYYKAKLPNNYDNARYFSPSKKG